MTSATISARTATTARSTVSSTSRIVGYAGTPSISSAFVSVLTAYNRPGKPPSRRLRSSAFPIVPSRRLAPISATLDGVSNRAIESASDRCSRACITPNDVSVGAMSNSTTITPSSNSRATL